MPANRPAIQVSTKNGAVPAGLPPPASSKKGMSMVINLDEYRKRKIETESAPQHVIERTGMDDLQFSGDLIALHSSSFRTLEDLEKIRPGTPVRTTTLFRTTDHRYALNIRSFVIGVPDMPEYSWAELYDDAESVYHRLEGDDICEPLVVRAAEIDDSFRELCLNLLASPSRRSASEKG
ncbi:MAG: hypothetical protein HQK59_13245 [Deltaproteobacteria bacterium]|nr:hypothetical protein [Deltaproteobacteria bacterium]